MITEKIDNWYNYENTFINQKYYINEIKNNPFAKFIFYIKEDKILGYIYYSDIYERAEINQIEVKSENRHEGIGSLLLKTALEKINKNVTLEVNKNNEYAIKLYLKFEFKIKCIRKGYYNGEDAYLMERTKK